MKKLQKEVDKELTLHPVINKNTNEILTKSRLQKMKNSTAEAA